MPPIRVRAKLDLVDGHEIGHDMKRHRLDGRHMVFGARRSDAFFACNQRDGIGPAQLDDTVIDLARQQAQRQADDPCLTR